MEKRRKGRGLVLAVLNSLILIMLVGGAVYAADELLKPDLRGDTMRPTASGAITNDVNGELVNLRVNPTSKRLLIESIDALSTVVNGIASITGTRTQLGSNSVNSCTFQAGGSNVGAIYVGGSTVTNAAGNNEGIKLDKGDSFGPVTLTNTNQIYFSTDNNGDLAKFFCN